MTVTDAETAGPAPSARAATVTVVDRFGVWLSKRQIKRTVGDSGRQGRRRLRLRLRGRLRCVGSSARCAARRWSTLSLAPDLAEQPEGARDRGAAARQPGRASTTARSTSSLCMSVIEHLWEPRADPRATSAGCCGRAGSAAINVPSWRGKRALEYSAFRLGLSPAEEMDDHKMYYDPKDLWPLMVKAGFMPTQHPCFRHKFGLNTFAVCRRRQGDTSQSDLQQRLPRARPWTWSRPSTPIRSRRSATGIAAVRERGGRLFILGVGGSAGLGQPRGQRLPQDLRRRVLLPHRQRLRADRPGQRRGLGHHLRGLAARLAARRRRRAPGLLGRRRQRREEGLHQHRGRARPGQGARRARSSASSAATAGTPPSWPTPASIVPPTYSDHITPHTEGLCCVIWHLLVSHPALAREATKWESVV